MYTKAIFGKELKEKVRVRKEIYDIGEWAFAMEQAHKEAVELDPEFQEATSQISDIIYDPYTFVLYEELDRIADYLITGNEAELDKEFEKQRQRRQIGFARELKERVFYRQNRYDLGHWAFSIFLDIKSDFGSILYAIATMESDPQFWYSYENLDQIADELLTGKKLDWQDFDKREKVDSEEVAE
jgi:hypothetical protein